VTVTSSKAIGLKVISL